IAPFDDVLEHAEDVASPLRLIRAERAWSMQHARRNQPAGAALQAIGLRQVEDAVVPLLPILEALAELVLGRSRLEPHERVAEVVVDIVVLRREVIALGLSFL